MQIENAAFLKGNFLHDFNSLLVCMVKHLCIRYYAAMPVWNITEVTTNHAVNH